MFDPDRRAMLIAEIGEDFMSELTTAFWSDAWPLLETATRAYAAADVSVARRALHTLCGSAGNIGFGAIADAAETASRHVKAGDIPDLGCLRRIMEKTRDALDGNLAA